MYLFIIFLNVELHFTFLVVWTHRMCCGYGLIECLVRMCLLYARCSISYSMYIHILLCLGGCRTLCVTMYVASPLNLLRRLPFILNTLCQNKSGISFEPSCWYGKELKEVIFTEHQECVAKPLCLSSTDCKEYLDYAMWLSEIFCMVWNQLHMKQLVCLETFEQCNVKRVVYEGTRSVEIFQMHILFVSRWLPNTLCYNVCGISF